MKKEFSVTPWSVSGAVHYTKLIKEFGIQSIEPVIKELEKQTKETHFMLRRGVFFAQRDLADFLKAHSTKKPCFLYTGRSPSGPVHLGHVMPWMFTKWLQDTLNIEVWFQFPDEEKFLFKQELSFEQAQIYLEENMIDVLALGFNPEKTHFLIDTRHASLMYEHACKVAKKITFSMVKTSFGLTDSSNIGSIFYTAMQTVPTFLPSIIAKKEMHCLIPHAVDQDPHFRLTRDIVPKLGYPKPASIQCVFLPPLSGMESKMSSSSEQSIFLSDTPEQVKKKINKYAFSGGKDTLEEHRKHGGNPDIDISFQYLRMLLESDDKKLEKIESDYKSGKLLSGELKAITIQKINEFLKEHQHNRVKAKKLLPSVILPYAQ